MQGRKKFTKILRWCSVSLTVSMLGTSVGSAQQKTGESVSLPPDTEVKTGTLPNGLTYYVRANSKPERQAKLMLVVRAGSNQEDDDQRGLAHFVEHMAFNGTKRFKEHELVNYLESIGLRFGADLNASTTFDRTMYELNVPTNNLTQLSTAFDILADWADGVMFDSAEVVAERGVILEEWRRNLGLGARIRDQQFPTLFNGSRYADRSPIGTPEIIQSANPSALKRYYHDWYRPNLMAVVAVGDFSPSDIERMIAERFSRMKNPVPERARETYQVPQNSDPLFSVITDSSIGDVSISVNYRIPKTTGTPATLARLSIAYSIFSSALNQRYREILRAPNPPFRGAQVNTSGLSETETMFSIGVVADPYSPMRSFSAALAEVDRIARFGISDAEMERLRSVMQKSTERSFSERHKTTSEAYAQMYAALFLGGDRTTDPSAQLKLFQEILPTITNTDIKKIAAIWKSKDNRIFLVTAPQRVDVLVPDTTSLVSIFANVEAIPLVAYEDAGVKNEPLLKTLPTPGTIVSKRNLEQGISEWKLSNGIRVLLRPSDQTTDVVLIQGQSAGGYYLNLDSVGFIPASSATQVVRMSGAGEFTLSELEKKLTGRNLQVGWAISGFDESVSAGGLWGDIETAFQLMYLSVTQPRIDTAAINRFKAQAKAARVSRVETPEHAFQDTMRLTMSQHHPLVLAELQADIDLLDPERSLQVVHDRFRDMSDFRFVIVGNFQLDSIVPYVEQYIASLPGGGRVETFKDPGIRQPTGMIRKTVSGGTDPKTVTVLSFYGPIEANPASQWNLNALGKVIQLRLTERLREQMGGTYTVQVNAAATRLPTFRYSIDISFVSAPERADELVKATLQELQKLQQQPALESDVQKVREAQIRNFSEQFKDDAVWAQRIALFDELKLPLSKITDDSVFLAWSAKDVQTAAKKYLNLKSFAHFDLVPQPTAATK